VGPEQQAGNHKIEITELSNSEAKQEKWRCIAGVIIGSKLGNPKTLLNLRFSSVTTFTKELTGLTSN
jgi:hypothetical protein